MFGGINNVTTIENLNISNSYAQNINDSLTSFPLDSHIGLSVIYLIPFGVKIWCREAVIRT
jgi:hypothetical protein